MPSVDHVMLHYLLDYGFYFIYSIHRPNCLEIILPSWKESYDQVTEDSIGTPWVFRWAIVTLFWHFTIIVARVYKSDNLCVGWFAILFYCEIGSSLLRCVQPLMNMEGFPSARFSNVVNFLFFTLNSGLCESMWDCYRQIRISGQPDPEECSWYWQQNSTDWKSRSFQTLPSQSWWISS